MNEVEEIKSRLDLVELVGSYLTLRKAGANYKAICPFHQEKTPSLMVSAEKQIWKCFGCQKGGTIYDFVMEAEHLEFGDALRLLAQKAGVTLRARTENDYQTHDRKDRLYRLNNLASRIWQKILLDHPSGKKALDYLNSRALKQETIKAFGLGLAPAGFDLKSQLIKRGWSEADLKVAGNPERFSERIIFPIQDVLGNVLGFTGRTVTAQEPKYLNSPETAVFKKSRVIYGLNLAKGAIRQRDYVVLVEGQMDVLALHQAGVAQTVASSGTAITETQLQILSRYTSNFLLGFDNDPAGLATTKRVVEMLIKNDLNSKVIDYGKFKDAGELFAEDSQNWRRAVRDAKEGVEWWISQEIKQAGPIQYIENKKKVLRSILPILRLCEPTRQDHYLQLLSATLQLKAESIRQTLRGRSAPKQPAGKNLESGQRPNFSLTNEEQVLTILLANPRLIARFQPVLEQVVWQSLDAAQIANGLKSCYNSKALTDRAAFLSQIKSTLDSRLTEKIDLWQIWLDDQWPNLEEKTAADLLEEKFKLLSTHRRESAKEQLATDIRQAQEAGDFSLVKRLMTKLNQLTKSAIND